MTSMPVSISKSGAQLFHRTSRRLRGGTSLLPGIALREGHASPCRSPASDLIRTEAMSAKAAAAAAGGAGAAATSTVASAAAAFLSPAAVAAAVMTLSGYHFVMFALVSGGMHAPCHAAMQRCQPLPLCLCALHRSLHACCQSTPHAAMQAVTVTRIADSRVIHREILEHIPESATGIHASCDRDPPCMFS